MDYQRCRVHFSLLYDLPIQHIARSIDNDLPVSPWYNIGNLRSNCITHVPQWRQWCVLSGFTISQKRHHLGTYSTWGTGLCTSRQSFTPFFGLSLTSAGGAWPIKGSGDESGRQSSIAWVARFIVGAHVEGSGPSSWLGCMVLGLKA